jgi:hypothetical protein
LAEELLVLLFGEAPEDHQRIGGVLRRPGSHETQLMAAGRLPSTGELTATAVVSRGRRPGARLPRCGRPVSGLLPGRWAGLCRGEHL